MSSFATAALASAGVTGETRPAGAAPLDEVVLATGVVTAASLALGWLLLAHRSGRVQVLRRATDALERNAAWSGTAGWAGLPLLVAMVSLITALLGMYWDISLHIGVGRDEGPLANPAHYPILIGLFGLSAAGALACALPRADEAGPAALRVSRTWRMPVGGVLLTAAGGYALLGFPLDDVWHRVFGQDVTLWGPTHLMLIGGAGLSLVAMAVLYEEGRVGRPDGARTRHEALSRARRYAQRVGVTGGLLIGLSVFQAEFDFGVPQFRLVLQPLLIALAAGVALVAARLWIGPGAALASVLFYLAVRGGVSVAVGPLVIGELWSAVPLYVVEALVVEVAAIWLARRPLALGAVAGVLVGTVGFAGEYAWTQLAFRLPWTPDMALEGTAMAVVGGVAGGVLGSLLALGLQRRLPRPAVARTVFGLATLSLAAAAVNGLWITRPADLTATITPSATSTGQPTEATMRVTFDRPPYDGEQPTWLTVTGWQGGGLHVDRLERLSATTFETTEPMPLGGTWKTVLRLHDGRDLSAIPVFMPSDRALDAEVVPAETATRTFGDEKQLLQRELNDDVPLWLWTAGGLVVLACSLTLLLALGWGVSRFARSGDAAPASPRTRAVVGR